MKTTDIKKTTKKILVNELELLGYRIDESMSFNYFNSANDEKYAARSCYLVEISSGLSFAHIDARRDNNFEKLQELRSFDYLIGNRVYEL